MNKKILKYLELLPFFTKQALLSLEKVGANTLNQNIKRWAKEGLIIRLKNGLYVTKTFVDRSLREARYVELIAGTLLSPSYLSLEYVMQKHNLLTEGTYAVTSVSTKSSRKFQNDIGSFIYRTVDPKLYFGFEQKKFGKNIYYEASVPKALFDFLYLRSHLLDPGDPSAIEELRINWDELPRREFGRLLEFAASSGIKKVKRICEAIGKTYYGKPSG